jgi:hypothetical protein
MTNGDGMKTGRNTGAKRSTRSFAGVPRGRGCSPTFPLPEPFKRAYSAFCEFGAAFGLFVTMPVSYTTVQRVTQAFPPIASVSNITSGVIAQYAGDVEGEINARVGSKYALPLTVDCPILTAIATRETIYRLAVQRLLIQFPPAQQGQHPMLVQHQGDQKLLEQIAAGTLKLVDASGVQITGDLSNTEIYSTTKNYNPTFHEGAWTDMVQDPAKAEDIKSDRSGY